MMRHALVGLSILMALGVQPVAALGAQPKTAARVWVAGRPMHFIKLVIIYGDPAAATDDPGLSEMLAAVGAQMTWQPGTRFVAITRADGKLLTFTSGSNVLTVDGAPQAMAFAPYYRGSEFYVPLLSLARGLGLGVRGYRSGYVFVPQIESVRSRTERLRTVVEINAYVPVAWRATYDARKRALRFDFEGFGTDARDVVLSGRDATRASVRMSGPPGYPTTSVSIDLTKGTKFASHRLPSGAGVDVVIARDQRNLSLAVSNPTPAAVIEKTPAAQTRTPQKTAPPTPQPLLSPSPIQQPKPYSPSAPVPTAQPVQGQASAIPSATASAPLGQAQASAGPAEAKVTNVAIVDLSGVTRILLTVSGPVSFEWHRLDQPDNRYWLDLHNATLVGPAQVLSTKLRFISDIRVSQHQITPEHIVRVSIAPTQPIAVQVGPIEGSQNEMGVEIETTAPSSDEPRAGVGTIAFSAQPSPAVSAVTHGDVIAIDPGHGGNDPGAINNAYGLVEKSLALQVSLAVRDRLARLGWHVVMTRDADYEVGDPNGDDRQELQARCDVANAAGARIFVSIHMNSWVGAGLNGTTTYYWRRDDKQFAQVVQAALVAADGLRDDGVKRDDLYVVKHTNMPAVLVEAAFVSNPHDAVLLQQRAFLDKLADGIVKGIMDYTGGPQS
jgi:N-acetylmuramoyl-L-alanine amidase